jgi:glycine hydroxymethyltransferase
VGIVVNRNVIPRDANRLGTISGIRLGTTAVTDRGMGTIELCEFASLIDRALMDHQDKQLLTQIKHNMKDLCGRFPTI